jgi:hypothetical protein
VHGVSRRLTRYDHGVGAGGRVWQSRSFTSSNWSRAEEVVMRQTRSGPRHLATDLRASIVNTIRHRLGASDRWLLAGAAFLVQLALGAVYAWSVFVTPLRDQIFNGVGRVLWGWTSDSVGRMRAFLMMFAIQGACFALLPVASSIGVFFLLGALVYLCYGGGFGTMPAAAADFFGPRNAGAIYGTIIVGWSIGGVLGPVATSVIADATDGYSVAFFIIAGMVLASTALPLTCPSPKLRSADTEASRMRNGRHAAERSWASRHATGHGGAGGDVSRNAAWLRQWRADHEEQASRSSNCKGGGALGRPGEAQLCRSPDVSTMQCGPPTSRIGTTSPSSGGSTSL